MHVNNGMAVGEVVKEGEICGSGGETGRLIVTNLHNYAMPFIRYETGDLATVGKACSCGRAFPILSRIEGRTTHWVLTRSLLVSWSRFLEAFETFNSIEQYQFIQTKVGELKLLIAPRSTITTTQMHHLKIS